MVSSLTRGQIIKKKLILDGPILRLLEKMKILIFNSLRTSYGDLKVCSKKDKFYLSRIATENLHKNVKFGQFLFCGPKTRYFKMAFFGG